MDAERLTPPSPTMIQVEQQHELAAAYAEAYDSDRARGVCEALAWVLGESLFPPLQLPDQVYLDPPRAPR